MMNIVLHQPEIPQNTGNIVRTCYATGSALHLIKPLGFSIDDKKLKRAGLDYWSGMDIRFYEDWEDFLRTEKPAGLWLLTTKAEKSYAGAMYNDGDYLVFGKETAGLPPEIRGAFPNIRVPMKGDTRSLNLSNTVALVLYESLRQQGFRGMA